MWRGGGLLSHSVLSYRARGNLTDMASDESNVWWASCQVGAEAILQVKATDVRLLLLIDEVFKVRVKSEQGEQKIIQDTTRMQKMINDLEAHINTSIIMEKSVRKSQDTQLGTELDRLAGMIKQLQAR